ncbi:DUF4270 family protein [Hymenobacter busanensis]|uniref:DUF4270 family protein n=1 Tax=Hymenobacter busanensis TaxID=2607656 RepID=UPI001367333C|nr:DUF4270 family protein [Hymenobacter busanensis]QHJ08410.1 DUF4270 family protein [Hymenobacter busanensis]
MFSLGSCEDPNELGLDLPGTTSISAQYEDLPVVASTILQDSLPTLKRDLWLVGQLRDNNTEATTTARSALNLVVSEDSLPSKFTNARFDSVVMYLGYSRVWGSATQLANFDVYNLAQPLNDRALYYSSTPIQVAGSPIANSGPVKLNRVIRNKANTADSIQLPLRLPLALNNSNSFFSGLFTKLNTTGFDQAALNSYFKGFALAPAASMQNAIIGFNRTAESELVFYYTAPNVKSKQKQYRLYFGDAVAGGSGAASPRYYTQIDYNRAGGRLAILANDKDSVTADVTDGNVYTQSGTGLATKLTIPGLAQLRNRVGLIVNRAELIVPVKAGTNALFTLPNALFLYEVNRNNRILLRTVNAEPKERAVQADGQNPRGIENEAALLSAEPTTGNRQFSTSLTSYVQAYLNNQLDGERPAGFLLTPSLRRAGQLSLDRAVLNASGIRLRVYYTTPK